jgi:hypothetical protein
MEAEAFLYERFDPIGQLAKRAKTSLCMAGMLSLVVQFRQMKREPPLKISPQFNSPITSKLTH